MKNIINNWTFKNLIERIVCVCEEIQHAVAFRSEFNGYIVDVFATKDNDFKIEVNEVGVYTKTSWINIDLTDEQTEQLQKIINQKVIELTPEEYTDEPYDVHAEQGLYGYGY